ncbi:hypothetical protein P691DRAFT_667271, partial [Macrolepiota fuliginosa MF-IS2]
VTGYHRVMGYWSKIPIHQHCPKKNLWGITDYGLLELWVITESTVSVYPALFVAWCLDIITRLVH